jgi:hypothetical protein
VRRNGLEHIALVYLDPAGRGRHDEQLVIDVDDCTRGGALAHPDARQQHPRLARKPPAPPHPATAAEAHGIKSKGRMWAAAVTARRVARRPARAAHALSNVAKIRPQHAKERAVKGFDVWRGTRVGPTPHVARPLALAAFLHDTQARVCRQTWAGGGAKRAGRDQRHSCGRLRH